MHGPQPRHAPDTQRRRLLGASLATLVSACAGSGTTRGPSTQGVPERNIELAVGAVDRLVGDLMTHSGVPGMAVAVVRDQRTIHAKGFGTRVIGTAAPVDADTVFQLASLSKSVGATAVAHEVGAGRLRWDSPIRDILPWFALKDALVTRQLTIGDLYSHRSGLPDHAGDRLEDMGYDQREVLERLRYLPLGTFRKRYAYTNFGLTAAGVAAASAAGVDWASLNERRLYAPLGMTRTSSRFADYASRSNHAVGHRQVAGSWQRVQPPRMPDAQAPAASVTSSVNDMAKWLAMLLGKGVYQGRRIVDEVALAGALSRQVETTPATEGRPASYYGYGFNVGTTLGGRVAFSHSGAFATGAATAFRIVPEAGLAIIALTNGWPVGVPEILNQQFFDLVEFGAVQKDWGALIRPYFDRMNAPEGSLVGVARPLGPKAPRALGDYAGVYRNDYHGPLTVSVAGNSLLVTLGATPLRLPLSHWDADTFTFTLDNENAAPGTLSKATFAPGRVTLEYYDEQGLGTFEL
jgi:CubicO group peptidase (beta-lactamase class C family)